MTGNFQKAMNLEDIYKSISPEPLINKADFDAFYRPEINELRGSDRISLMALGLQRAHGALPYKAFLMGHSGVGKSTELTRLAGKVEDKYRVLRFSAMSELDPISFQPFDVLLLMAAEIAKKTALPLEEGGAGQAPSEKRIEELWSWFAEEQIITKTANEKSAQLAAGLKPGAGSWWAKALGLFASVQGEMKFASKREKQFIEYRLSRMADLIEYANRLFDECNKLMIDATEREWLIVGEDFDKAGIPLSRTEDLFVTYSNVFKFLRSHMIFVIPIALGYSSKSRQLPVPSNQVHCLTDTPVFDREHQPNKKGRDAVRAVLDARVDSSLFDKGQIERLIVASGGNLRDLFSLVSTASDLAILRGDKQNKIEARDVDAAIRTLRTEYEHQLGEDVYDSDPQVKYPEKAERLVRIYKGEPDADVPDSVLYALLRSRALQEYNGERWLGLHPLVVDVLAEHGRLEKPEKGAVPGGTR